MVAAVAAAGQTHAFARGQGKALEHQWRDGLAS